MRRAERLVDEQHTPVLGGDRCQGPVVFKHRALWGGPDDVLAQEIGRLHLSMTIYSNQGRLGQIAPCLDKGALARACGAMKQSPIPAVQGKRKLIEKLD